MSIAATYAEALLEAAEDGGAVDAVADDLRAFARAAEESPELREVLTNPGIDSEDKKRVLAALAAEAHPLVRNFLQVLVDRGRAGQLLEIAEAFEDRLAEAAGRVQVEALTAVPLPDDLREALIGRLRQTTGRDVELTTSVDPDILGGLVLRTDTAVVDASVRARLDRLRATLLQAPIEGAAVAD